MVISIKYHVPSQGIVDKNQIWRIYENINEISKDSQFQGLQGVGIQYVEHIEIEDGVDSWTGNSIFRVGFSLICEGEIEYTEENGVRKARIYK